MTDLDSSLGQDHPLYSIDRSNLDRLLAKKTPEEEDIVELARLIIRYEGFPGAKDIQQDTYKTLKFWGLSREVLNQRAKEIWENGYRPRGNMNEEVGSGFDTTTNNEQN